MKNKLKIALLASLVAQPVFAKEVDDRVLHAGVSVAIGSGMIMATNDRLTSYAVCGAAGLAKEVYDEIDYGGFSGKDMFYDVLGCIIGIEASIHILGINVTPSASSESIGLNLNYKF